MAVPGKRPTSSFFSQIPDNDVAGPEALPQAKSPADRRSFIRCVRAVLSRSFCLWWSKILPVLCVCLVCMRALFIALRVRARELLQLAPRVRERDTGKDSLPAAEKLLHFAGPGPQLSAVGASLKFLH